MEIVRRIAKTMDELFSVPGTRLKVGLDSIIGLIPGVGDVGTAAVGAYLLRAASRLGVPLIIQARMLLNILIDTLLGLVPIIGDYLDVLYKANAKNAQLVVQSVEERGTGSGSTTRSSWFMFILMLLALIAIVVGGFIGMVLLAKWAWNLI